MTIYGVHDQSGKLVQLFKDSGTAGKLAESRKGYTVEPYELRDRVQQCDQVKQVNRLTQHVCQRPLGHDGDCQFPEFRKSQFRPSAQVVARHEARRKARDNA